MDTSSLNSEISAQRNAIQKAHTEIGEQYYKENEAAPPDAYKDFFDAIVAANHKIVELQAEIEKIKGTQACPSCGAEVPKETKFCAGCGNKMPETITADVTPVAPGTKACPSCGSAVDAANMFCGECGHKF